MNRNVEFVVFAISATLFAAIFLCSVIVFGPPLARNLAIGAALLSTMSQFTGQDQRAYRVSIGLAYAAFALSAVALVCMFA